MNIITARQRWKYALFNRDKCRYFRAQTRRVTHLHSNHVIACVPDD